MNETRIAIPTRIAEGGVVAIGRRLDPRTVVQIGEGLVAGGVGAFEITFGSDDVLASIEALAARFAGSCGDPELLIGAGTVLTIPQAEQALRAGARFLVMPVTDPALVAWAATRGVPTFPGAMTPTEALAGWRAGAAGIKLFPASVAGPAWIRELHGPFPEIPVIPTGGVSVANAADFIAAGAVAVGLGSWLTGDGDPRLIAQRGRRVVAAVQAARRGGAA